MSGEIKCDNLADFMDTIEALVHRGLVFEANTVGFRIKLTGGY